MYNTIKCPHCKYSHGWDYTLDQHNPTWVEGKYGDFYELQVGLKDVYAHRFHGDKNFRSVKGCPSCDMIFMSTCLKDAIL